MKLFITAIPLFTSAMSVGAYNMCYQDSSKLFGTSHGHTVLDGVMYSPGLDMLNTVGIEAFTRGKPVCVPFTRYNLLSDCAFGCETEPGLITFILTKELPLEETYLQKCLALKEAGYSLALSGIDYTPASAPFYDAAGYVVIDTGDKNYFEKLMPVRTKYPYIKVIFTNVADMSAFGGLTRIDNSLFEGEFYSQPISKGVKEISPLKANAMNLLRLVLDEDYDLDEVAEIMHQDMSLSVSFMKFVNSPALGIRNKINSIQNALALLGQRETRKWITASVSIHIAEDKPNEITKLSLTRAKFAENLAEAFEMGTQASTLFLMGLFSLLDVVLDMPMEKAIQEVPFDDKVRDALVESKGEYADVLRLICAYERADWKTASQVMILKNVDPQKINEAFIDSLTWYRDLLLHL